jgi:hypothetical protein
MKRRAGRVNALDIPRARKYVRLSSLTCSQVRLESLTYFLARV